MISGELTAIALGLASALVWGGGDFCGGLATRRISVLRVLLVGQGTGLLLLLAMALVWRESLPSAAGLLWSMAAGAAGLVGLAALYRALASGSAAVVAPTSAVLAAALPVLFGALTEGLPTSQRLAGLALALAGIWLVAQTNEATRAATGLELALLAGCGFGGFFILVHQPGDEGTFWPLVAARGIAMALTLPLLLLQRQEAQPQNGLPGLAVLAGVLDVGGNTFYVLAGQAGRLDIAAVLSSLYPASTVLLSRLILGEPITWTQRFGLATILTAIALIAGSG